MARAETPREQQAEGNWKQFKGRLREAWGSLTDDEIDRYRGRREQLEGYIEEQTGEARENVRKRIDEMTRNTRYRW